MGSEIPDLPIFSHCIRDESIFSLFFANPTIETKIVELNENQEKDALQRIDISRLVKGKKHKNDGSYSIEEIKEFAKCFRIPQSQCKSNLIDSIVDFVKKNSKS
jgi:hypothetical protein